MTARGLMCAALATMAMPAGAVDRWEYRGDNGEFSNNALQPGIVQEAHDLEGANPADEDWFKVRGQGERSYEARVFGAGVVWKYPACPTCATFDRIDRDGNVIQAGETDNMSSGSVLWVRWISTPQTTEWLRAKNGTEAPGISLEKYDVILVDTTLFLSRFNNVGSQRTLLVLQNIVERPVEGRITFRDTSGGLLAVAPVKIAAGGSLVLETGGIAALAGQAGSASIAHTGGMSALTGKGVAVDPATGFTFDTPLVGVDR